MGCMADFSQRPYIGSNLLCKRDRDFVSCVRTCHLPLASALEVAFTLPIIAFIVLANSLFGLIAGYLYWQKGLEAAIIAHMSTHIVIVNGNSSGNLMTHSNAAAIPIAFGSPRQLQRPPYEHFATMTADNFSTKVSWSSCVK